MAASIVVIADEATCAGFRLAGADTRTPHEADLPAAFATALAQARLVVVTRRFAEALAPDALRDAMARVSPLVVVMPGIDEPEADVGLARRIRAVLGIES
jgi:vacuolar-type H+-ATPase subunit F/Vma7